MQLNVDGEFGGMLPAHFINLERHINVFSLLEQLNTEKKIEIEEEYREMTKVVRD